MSRSSWPRWGQATSTALGSALTWYASILCRRARNSAPASSSDFDGAVAPAELGPARHLTDARRAIPGRVDVPLHVGVVGEQLAVPVVRRVVLVAEAVGDEFPLLAVGIDVVDAPAGGEDAGHEPVAVG